MEVQTMNLGFEPSRHRIKEQLREAYRASGMTMGEIATKAGITLLGVKRVLNPEHHSTLFQMDRVAHALGKQINLGDEQ
jgi:DNA-binding phage protein